MSRMRVLQVNLHLTAEGCLMSVSEVSWKGTHRDLRLVQRRYLEGPGLNATPMQVMQAVANTFALPDPGYEVPDSSS